MGSAWKRFQEILWFDEELQVSLDASRMQIDLDAARPAMARAFLAMQALERGGIANPDEGRRVGHYWLRAPDLAPDEETRRAIALSIARVESFASRVHAGAIRPQRADRFGNLLLIGIGGSALGPQFVADALGAPSDPLQPFFLDNTDPDGMDRVFATIGSGLDGTLVVVVSKSGGTQETRNGMLEAKRAYKRAGLDFAKHAVAVTGEGSALSRAEPFLEVFPMWDWVGGRTSVFSAVGLLPAALQGFAIHDFLEGARLMDERTRAHRLEENPAALLAASWHAARSGNDSLDMVVLPYKDRLLLFARYLQQLVMESLGKKVNRKGEVVHQGIVVYGNKGSTDQHAFVQQLREGPDDFFATFIEVLRDREGPSLDVDAGATSGDYLLGFLLGTRDALTEAGRSSLTVTLPEVNARSLGALIALYERAVGLYAELVDINAYHQPGVEAGKKAAARVLDLQQRALETLRKDSSKAWTIEELAAHLGAKDHEETLYKVLEHAAANPDHGVTRSGGQKPSDALFRAAGR